MAFAQAPGAEGRHAWHLKHVLAGTREGVALLLDAFARWPDCSPVVWLAATSLCTILSGSGSRDQGTVQSTLLALRASACVVRGKGARKRSPLACAVGRTLAHGH